MIDFKYRPDVDGLRAVAVSLVLLFHAGLGFSGGFVGVDVFFVLSGFLITGLILKEQDAGKFSLRNFWVRRIRRIIPAAWVMVFTVLVAGFFLLLPSDYTDLGKSTIAQQLMLSNVYFWQNTGYFDGPAESKPLLHAWSLAVEEQFYLGYPFLLMLLHRFGRRATLIVLGLIGIGSLVISQYGVQHFPSATFFLLPTRAWELLIGGLICFLPKPSRIKHWILTSCSWLSLAAILGAGWFYSSTTPFPGIAALVPCVATAVLIYSNSTRLSFPAALLATKPIVFIGLISYSLYLWHWPVMAFGHYWSVMPRVPLGILSIITSGALAYASWKYVETPFRHNVRRDGVGRNTLGIAAMSAGLLLSVSALVWVTRGIPSRFDERINALTGTNHRVPNEYSSGTRALKSDNVPIFGRRSPDSDDLKFVVWGDSHALALCKLFEESAVKYGVPGAVIARSSHPPLMGVYKTNTGPEMMNFNHEAIEFIRRHNVRHAFIVARWSVLIEAGVTGKDDKLLIDESSNFTNAGRSEKLLATSLRATLTELQNLGVKVWLIKQVPLQRADPLKAMIRAAFWGDDARGVTINQFLSRHSRANEIIDQSAASFDDVVIVDPRETCFGQDGISHIGDARGCYYADDDHLSPYGATTLLRPLIEPIFATSIADGGAISSHVALRSDNTAPAAD